MKKQSLSEAQLMNTVGGHGTAEGSQSWEYGNFAISLPTYYHKNCGGRIIQGDIFHNCRCEKCGEDHYFLESFKYMKIYGIKPPELKD